MTTTLVATAFGCASAPKPFLVAREFTAPKDAPKLSKDAAVRFFTEHFAQEIVPPGLQPSYWEASIAAGGVSLPIAPIPHCDAGLEEFRLNSEKNKVSAAGKLNMVPCVRRVQGPPRSDQEQKLIQAILGSLKFSDEFFVESTCSKKNLAQADSWRFNDLVRSGTPTRLCPEDQTQRFIMHSRRRTSFKLGPDEPNTALSRATMLSSGKPCSRFFVKGTLRMRRCSMWFKAIQDGEEGGESSTDVWMSAHARDVVGTPGQPYYSSGTWTISINNWKGSLKFQGPKREPTWTLSDGKETAEGSLKGRLATTGGGAPVGLPTPQTPAATPVPNPALPAAPPETEPIIGVFQVLGFSRPDATQSHILPYRDGSLITSNTRNIQPTITQLSCDRVRRVCWGLNATQVGPVNIRTGELQAFTKAAGAPAFSSLAGVAFDSKTQKLFVLAGRDRGSLYTWVAPGKQWSSPGQVALEKVQGLVFLSGDRNLYAAVAEERPGKQLALTALHKLTPEGAAGSVVNLTFALPLGTTAAPARVQIVDASPWILALVTQTGSTAAEPKETAAEKSKFLPTTVFRIDPFTGTVHLIR